MARSGTSGDGSLIILALDLGASTGWCVGSKTNHTSGVWTNKARRFEGGGMKFLNFRANLIDVRRAWPNIDRIYFEEVRRHAGVDAAHAYAGYLAALTMWAEDEKLPYAGLPVGSIKKFWCGSGNASKERMIAESIDRGYQPKTDDEADAQAIFHYGMSLAEE